MRRMRLLRRTCRFRSCEKANETRVRVSFQAGWIHARWRQPAIKCHGLQHILYHRGDCRRRGNPQILGPLLGRSPIARGIGVEQAPSLKCAGLQASAVTVRFPDKALIFFSRELPVRHAEHRGGVDGHQNAFHEGRSEEFSPISQNANRRAHYRGGRGGAEANNDRRLYNPKFGFKPGAASRNFPRPGFLMNPSFAPRFPVEMLDRVCEIAIRA